jgi:hypothetical protein
MTDMSQVIAPKSDQINADDLIAGDITITVTDVKVVGGQEQPVSIHFAGSQKVYRPCKSMSRVLAEVWGIDAKVYVGRSLTLYRDPDVKWGGLAVGGIRIRKMTHMPGDRAKTMPMTVTKGVRRPFTVVPLVLDAPKPNDDGQAIAEARTAAAKGTDAFRAWFKANPSKRDALREIMESLKADCERADEAGREQDPFGLPPLADDAPDPDAIARAMAEAEAEADKQARGAA